MRGNEILTALLSLLYLPPDGIRLLQVLHLPLFFYDQEKIRKIMIDFRCHPENIFYMNFRNQQNMDRRTWLDILKSKPMLVFINFYTRNLPADNFTKQTVIHFLPPFVPYRSFHCPSSNQSIQNTLCLFRHLYL